jgi:hypothetical protein
MRQDAGQRRIIRRGASPKLRRTIAVKALALV